jgi:hypothetical protein
MAELHCISRGVRRVDRRTWISSWPKALGTSTPSFYMHVRKRRRRSKEQIRRFTKTDAVMTDSISRLRLLPEIFTFVTFCRFTRLSDNAAAVCLHRWKSKGLIEVAGERAGIYFNKLKCAQIDGSHRRDALLLEYPSAALCGESVLHAAGWITQIPARLSVAVISRPSYISLHGFDIHGRTLYWFNKVHPAIDPAPEKRVYGLRALPPPLALVDLYGDRRGWHPDIDDLDIPAEEEGAVLSAAALLEVDLPRPLQQEIEARQRLIASSHQAISV